MKPFWHGVFHVAMTASQVALATGKFVPPPWNIAVIGGGALFQGIVALRAQKKAAKAAGGT
jgi:hypothetical protein